MEDVNPYPQNNNKNNNNSQLVTKIETFIQADITRKARPDTWQSGRGGLGGSSNARTAWNSNMLHTDRHGKF